MARHLFLAGPGPPPLAPPLPGPGLDSSSHSNKKSWETKSGAQVNQIQIFWWGALLGDNWNLLRCLLPGWQVSKQISLARLELLAVTSPEARPGVMKKGVTRINANIVSEVSLLFRNWWELYAGDRWLFYSTPRSEEMKNSVQYS